MHEYHSDSRNAKSKTRSEEIQLLNAISRVSARLARNLKLLSISQAEEGGQPYGTSEKSCRYCGRASRMQ